MLRSNRGFTLIEVIVVAAIIAILAGILVPMIFSQIDESKITRAQADIKSIQSAIIAFRKDVGAWPKSDGTTLGAATILTSNGTDPTSYGTGWDVTTPGLLDASLTTNQNGVYPIGTNTTPGWKGPYSPSVGPDPWGNKYVINIKQAGTSGATIFILSAGPPTAAGLFPIDTEAADNAISSADIGTILSVEK